MSRIIKLFEEPCPFLEYCKEKSIEIGLGEDHKESCPKNYTTCSEYKMWETASLQADVLIKKFHKQRTS